MVDQVLSWVVVFAPFLLSILFIFIPEKSENRAVHMRWRAILVLFGAAFSVIAWIQQSRATKAAFFQEQESIMGGYEGCGP
jgi:Na+-transporting NADH:ubiquinone oxidoreductase subunit NqrB